MKKLNKIQYDNLLRYKKFDGIQNLSFQIIVYLKIGESIPSPIPSNVTIIPSKSLSTSLNNTKTPSHSESQLIKPLKFRPRTLNNNEAIHSLMFGTSLKNKNLVKTSDVVKDNKYINPETIIEPRVGGYSVKKLVNGKIINEILVPINNNEESSIDLASAMFTANGYKTPKWPKIDSFEVNTANEFIKSHPVIPEVPGLVKEIGLLSTGKEKYIRDLDLRTINILNAASHLIKDFEQLQNIVMEISNGASIKSIGSKLGIPNELKDRL